MWRAIRPWLFPVWCAGCGAAGIALCAPCRATLTPARLVVGEMRIAAAALYDGPLRAAVLALKRGERAYLAPLAALVAAQVPPGATLVPVVTTRRRAAERGFDQARELARRAAGPAGAALADVLRKRGRAQHGRDRDARLAACGRFRVCPGVSLPRTAILVDDVVTTGATLRDAAATLARAGVAVAGAVVIAHAPLRETSPGGRESHEA